jgi:hypothetical protein
MGLPIAPGSTPTPTPAHVRPAAGPLHLRGLRLALARGGWATLATLIVAFFLACLPVYFAQLRTVCLHAPCAPWQLTPARAHALGQFHVSSDGYALASLFVSVSSALTWFVAAALIAWRQSRQWLALLSSLLLLVQGVLQMTGYPETTPLEYGAPVWHAAAPALVILSIALFLLVFALFPNGRFVPGWMRWVVAVVPAPFGVYVFTQPSTAAGALVVSPPLLGALAGAGACVAAAQIYRYRRVSTPVERQQTKWIVMTVVEGPLVGIVYFSLPLLVPALGRPDSLYVVLAKSAYSIAWLFVPLCVGIAILRYRLWDIDLIIRLTLVYGTLTALLAAAYVGLVVAAQAAVRALTGQVGEQPVIIVASTLLVVALSTPLRHAIQAAIDRRFYRRKADAERTLAAFGATLGREVDLARLSAQLLAVVEETMQPKHTSLWLRGSPLGRAQGTRYGTTR